MPKEKKPRAKKDPNAPKKALSAFMIFSSENRSKVKEENPDAGFGKFSYHQSLGNIKAFFEPC